MRVLIVSQYFAPEINAAANRVHAFAAGLVRRGHEVEVVCEVPNHPVGVVASGFGGHFVERRRLDGARVKYVWVYVTSSKAIRPRLTNYVSFGITGTLVGLATRRPDVIFASSPPLPVGGAGLAVAARHRRPWVLDVRDHWPDAAVALGQVEEGPLLSAARRLERRLYRSSAAITVTTEPTRQLIEGRAPTGRSQRRLPVDIRGQPGHGCPAWRLRSMRLGSSAKASSSFSWGMGVGGRSSSGSPPTCPRARSSSSMRSHPRRRRG